MFVLKAFILMYTYLALIHFLCLEVRPNASYEIKEVFCCVLHSIIFPVIWSKILLDIHRSKE